MKKGLLFLLLAAALSIDGNALDVHTAPETSAEAMVLIHPASGTVLAEKNADKPLRIASTTKLMTALTAAEMLPMDREVEIRAEWTGVEGSSMYLRAGEDYTVRELLQGLLLASGNDSALALAAAAAGDEGSFVERMNEQTRRLGLRSTHFENPHGLDDPNHYSCASDLAAIMAAALRSEPLRRIMAERSCTIHGTVYENHNKLLRTCRGVFAGKTGFTKAAGRCLVTACEREGMELICVTLSDPEDWKDHASLYDWAYENYRVCTVSTGDTAGELPVISGETDTAAVSVPEDVSVCVPRSAGVRFVCSLPPFAYAPLNPGDPAGTLTILVDDRPAASAPLVWSDSVRRSGAAVSFRDLVDRLLGVYRI